MNSLNLLDFENIQCQVCQSIFWKEVLVYKDIPAPSLPEDTIDPIKIVICNECNSIHPDYVQIYNTQIEAP